MRVEKWKRERHRESVSYQSVVAGDRPNCQFCGYKKVSEEITLRSKRSMNAYGYRPLQLVCFLLPDDYPHTNLIPTCLTQARGVLLPCKCIWGHLLAHNPCWNAANTKSCSNQLFNYMQFKLRPLWISISHLTAFPFSSICTFFVTVVECVIS